MYTDHNFTAASLGFSTRRIPSHESISRRAQILWRIQGCPPATDLAIWLQAEKLLTAEGRKPAISIHQQLLNGYPETGNGHRSTTSL
jgi:hypothetical protein